MLIKLTISQTNELTLIDHEEIATVEINRKGPGSVLVLKNGKFRFVDESIELIYSKIFGRSPDAVGNCEQD